MADKMDRDTAQEQYRSCATDLDNAVRRLSVTNTAHFVVVIALMAWVGHAQVTYPVGAKAQFVVLVLALFGGALCWIWSNTIRFQRAVLSAKYAVLAQIEDALGMAGARREAELWSSRTDAFTLHDPRAPLVLIAYFVVVAFMAVGRIL